MQGGEVNIGYVIQLTDKCKRHVYTNWAFPFFDSVEDYPRETCSRCGKVKGLNLYYLGRDKDGMRELAYDHRKPISRKIKPWSYSYGSELVYDLRDMKND